MKLSWVKRCFCRRSGVCDMLGDFVIPKIGSLQSLTCREKELDLPGCSWLLHLSFLPPSRLVALRDFAVIPASPAGGKWGKSEHPA